jgi:ribonuclease R
MKRRSKKRRAEPASMGQAGKPYAHPIPSRDEILKSLERVAGPLPLGQLGARFSIRGDKHLRALEQRLKAMVRDGQLIRNRAREYGLTEHLDLVAGTVSAHRDGYGFLRPDDGTEDIYLSARDMQPLWSGDRVAVRVSPGRRGGREGHVVEILQRARTEVIGTLRSERGIDYVLQEGDVTAEVLIARGARGHAKRGDIVRVEILEHPTARSHAIGRVVEIVGRIDTPGVETEVAILTHGIPHEWPADVLEVASSLPSTVPSGAKHNRIDLRHHALVTIDGADAKDFDDAVYCERQGTGWRLFVAIADVSHYVAHGSAVDREAKARGTSVYFPDRVVPMLPEALSNGLCSLKPHVDRLCVVCEMQVTAQGKVTRSRFYDAVMRSAARLTYTEAWELLSRKSASAKRPELAEILKPLNEVYRAFAAARRRRGAIDFELPETKIELDASGQVKHVHPVERLTSHKIIEECMIAANVEAAKRLRKHRVPSLYRVHDEPDPERIDELFLFLKTFGFKLPPAEKVQAKDLSRVMRELSARPEAELIEMMILRSMNQALYQPKNIGHFGLALGAYAHFTSPIRRYPDLLVHRAIKWLNTHSSLKGFGYSMADMTALGELTSRAERRADEAVWDVEEQLKCAYMRERVGESFDAVVSSVVPFGVFVRIPSLAVDGLVHVSSLPRDYYHREPSGAALVGERTGRRFGLTDAMRVRLVGVNLEERKIDFVPDSEPEPTPVTKRPRRRRRRG